MVSIFIRTILIYIILNVLMRMMGKRQIGELEVNELVSTLLISEIASISISDSDISLLPAIIPMLFIASMEVVISTVKNKSRSLKRIVEGEPSYIIYRGRLNQDVLKENRISINELLTEMRIQGIADISDIWHAILEQNGKLSIIELKDKESYTIPIIIDGAVDSKNLKITGNNEGWLKNQLNKAGINTDDVFLLTVNDSGDVNIIRKDGQK